MRCLAAVVGQASRLQQLLAGFVNRGAIVVNATHQGEAVRQGGQTRQGLAQKQARHGGGDRSKRTADAAGGVGLGIQRIEMTRASAQPEQDGPLGRARLVLPRGG
jgi:hypothetical protein